MQQANLRPGSSGTDVALPLKLKVVKLVTSRYPDARRPVVWDDRRSGIDVVEAEGSGQIRLVSDGQQSPPREGWVIVLTEGNSTAGYRWTLYGMPGK